MRYFWRWASLALLLICLALAGVIRHQSDHLAGHEEKATTDERAYRETIGRLEAENESLRVELAVRNVLDEYKINVPRDQLRRIGGSIIQVSHRYDLPPELILGIIFTESSFDVRAESPKGAMGLMQLMPATANSLAADLELEWKGNQLLTDPQINILLGGFYLRRLIHRFQGLDNALAAYNLGPTKMRELLSRRRQPGAHYVRRVQEVARKMRERYF